MYHLCVICVAAGWQRPRFRLQFPADPLIAVAGAAHPSAVPQLRQRSRCPLLVRRPSCPALRGFRRCFLQYISSRRFCTLLFVRKSSFSPTEMSESRAADVCAPATAAPGARLQPVRRATRPTQTKRVVVNAPSHAFYNNPFLFSCTKNPCVPTRNAAYASLTTSARSNRTTKVNSSGRASASYRSISSL